MNNDKELRFRPVRMLTDNQNRMLRAIERATDGGPGSGNFGHKGRPGQRGGSGEGGSKKYRDQSKADLSMNGTLAPIGSKFSNGRKSKKKKPSLLKAEKEALFHELNTYISEDEINQGYTIKYLFGSVYGIEILDFGAYNVVDRRTVDPSERKEYCKEFKEAGKHWDRKAKKKRSQQNYR